ncbi:MAG: metallophosphoesterase [Smithella sp.]
MLKVLHLADIHPREKDAEELKKCLSFVVMVAQSEKVDLTLIAGDTFSLEATNKIDSPVVKLIIEAVSALADIGPVFIIEGTQSHDGAAPEILQYVKGKYPVHVTTMPEQIYVKQLDVVLTLIPTPTKQFFKTEGGIVESNSEISMAMNAVFAGFGAQAHEFPTSPHILSGHWNVSGSILPTGQVMTGKDIDIGFDQMMLAAPDLIALGHIHKPQQIGDRAFYSGSLYPLTWGELEAKGFYIHELDGHKLVESRFIETPIRKLIRVEEDLVNEIESKDFDMEIVKGAYVRVDFTVYQDEAGKIDKEATIAFYKDFGAIDVDIRIIRVPRQTVRSESVLKVNTLRDKIKAMAELREETVSESVLQKADLLEYGEEKEQVAA